MGILQTIRAFLDYHRGGQFVLPVNGKGLAGTLRLRQWGDSD